MFNLNVFISTYSNEKYKQRGLSHAMPFPQGQRFMRQLPRLAFFVKVSSRRPGDTSGYLVPDSHGEG